MHPFKFIFFLLMCSPVTHAQFKLIESKDMRMVYYDREHEYILPHTERCFYNALNFHKKLFDYKPSEKINILMQDFGDYGNGGATAVPHNFINLALSPFNYTFETSPTGERMFSLMNHELVHVVAMDNSNNKDRFFQKLFLGKVYSTKEHPISALYSYLTSPRFYSPRWYHEGIAAYVETWMSGGIGLAMGSYDEMVFRTRVLEQAHIYSAQGLESEGTTTDFQGRSNSYLYGTRFMGYLAYTYGPQKIIDWVKSSEGSKRAFSGQFKNVFNKPLTTSWSDWINFEKSWQQKNIIKLRESPISILRPVTEKIIGSVSFPHYDRKRNRIYFAINYPGKIAHLAAMNLKDGTITRLTDIKGAALFYVSSVAYDAAGDKLFFTTDNNAMRDLNSYDLRTHETKQVQKNFRTGDLTYNKTDNSIWGVQHESGYSTIVRVPSVNASGHLAPYSTVVEKYKLPYGHDIFDLDISPDGKILSAAVSDYKGNQSLLFFDLENLEFNVVKADTIFNFEISSPQSFRFTDDGKYLYGCSYYSGVSNIYRVTVATKEILPMSNAITGLFRPLLLDTNKLLAFNFISKGFQPVYLENKVVDQVGSIEFLGNVTIEKHPILKTWELPMASSRDLDMDSLTTRSDYKPGKAFELNAAYPIVLGYKNYVGLGYSFDFEDPLGFRSLKVTASFTPRTWTNQLASHHDTTNISLDQNEIFHFSLAGKVGKYSFNAGYNEANFYDLFGPTKTSRKGSSLRLEYSDPIIYNPPKTLDLTIGTGGYYGLEKSPEFQQISTQGFNNNIFFNLDGALNYSFTKSSIGSVDPEKGIKASLKATSVISSGSIYPRVQAALDLGFQLPIHHSSVWIRSATGHSFSKSFNPFTRFGFAAFGNNFIDYQISRRYRTIYSFPGLSYDADVSIISRSFLKSVVEWTLPPIRFRELGGLNLYSNWIQPSVFSSGLITADPTSIENKFINMGTQLDMKIVIFSLLESTLSLGYAKAFDLNRQKTYNEWMLSLKLLK